MKNLSKITTLFFVFFGLAIGSAYSQSATSPATMSILADLTIALEAGTSINFGKLSATTPGVIKLDPNDFANNENVNPTTSNVARFNVTGSPNAGITVTYDATVPMTRDNTSGGAADVVSLTPTVVGDALLANKATAAAIPSNGGVTLEATAGSFFIWVGGELPQFNAQATGDYTGTFNISVAYN
ncbi:DUF4402 domain-containing protein [uncultured Algoriphagus sp.]|uniref:DUF4402 domain-containing protein n=1 Tax=uncultured Algoriphagus sp. TaxID=417365 RepID=UPI00259646F9|nr:DUF4402 domain-containing protein [uncultured Algoriphagus sp.]